MYFSAVRCIPLCLHRYLITWQGEVSNTGNLVVSENFNELSAIENLLYGLTSVQCTVKISDVHSV
jgi:hypothetical protein